MKKQVFLGGACGTTTWRRDIAIPALESAGVTYHNPQLDVGEWFAAHEVADMNAKDEADVLLFVIAGNTRGVASIAEVAYLLAARRPLALTLTDVPEDACFEGRTISAAERDDLNRGRLFVRTMAAQQGVPVFPTIAEAVHHAIDLARNLARNLTREAIQTILAEVAFQGAEFLVEEMADSLTLQVKCDGVDSYTSIPCALHGRKWPIDRKASRSDVVRTAFKAVLTWVEHEARESFTYRGARIFGPHLDVDRLAALTGKKEDL